MVVKCKLQNYWIWLARLLLILSYKVSKVMISLVST